jgi:hypothetical protein
MREVSGSAGYPVYTLNCDACGMPFKSDSAFPKPQLCHDCRQPRIPTGIVKVTPSQSKRIRLQKGETMYPDELKERCIKLLLETYGTSNPASDGYRWHHLQAEEVIDFIFEFIQPAIDHARQDQASLDQIRGK